MMGDDLRDVEGGVFTSSSRRNSWEYLLAKQGTNDTAVTGDAAAAASTRLVDVKKTTGCDWNYVYGEVV